MPDIDQMIKAYSDELMRFANENNVESLVIKKQEDEAVAEDDMPQKIEEEPLRQEALSEAPYEEPETQTAEAVGEENGIPDERDMENPAVFRARVFTGKGAYAVENAKVILYRNDVLHAFLVTDKNGETPEIKIEAYPQSNSLEPLSDEQRLDYRADVYAEGFERKENLLVSAVGGSDILLEVELTPESEGIG